MAAFRILLIVLFVCMSGYTAVVIAHHGIGLFEVFFGSIAEMGWSGQFNVDFTSYLTLAALWIAWRHHYSPVGIVLGFFGGALVFTVYLFVASLDAKGSMEEVLLGRVRAA